MAVLRRTPPRRRREGVTDYRARLKLVKSGRPRLVVRRTNRYVIVQLVESRAGGDRTVFTVTSKVLSKYGWRAGTKNTPAAYLTGCLAGKLAVARGYTEAIADIGMRTPSRGARVFAAIKGAIDAGLRVTASEEIFPDEVRIRGEVIAEYVRSLGDGARERFSASDIELLKDLPSHFEEVLERIRSG